MTTPTASATLTEILESLAAKSTEHARTHPTYQAIAVTLQQIVAESPFASADNIPVPIGGFGPITFPYYKMGAVSTLDLFGLDEMLIFAFYWANRNRYRRSADIGANLGLHSVLMSKCGWQVTSFEPDPNHAALNRRNLGLNQCASVTLEQAAVSDKVGTLEFVRVVGNTTSSHLAGSKSNAYGDLVKFPVRVASILDVLPNVDFVKMDAEGQEKTLIVCTTAEHWQRTDMMVEIGTPENATAIFEHLQKLGVNAFAQKLGWGKVQSLSDMPVHYKEGSVFISRLPVMPWA